MCIYWFIKLNKHSLIHGYATYKVSINFSTETQYQIRQTPFISGNRRGNRQTVLPKKNASIVVLVSRHLSQKMNRK